MLNAILYGKKRGSGAEGKSLADEFIGAEDTLTATVFERLLYLPDDIVGHCLFSLFERCTIPNGKITTILFWPRLTAVTNIYCESSNCSIEPDIIVEWADRILIIEAKRRDYTNLQEPKQLAQEWLSANVAYPEKTIYMLAVGGIADSRKETISNLYSSIISFLPNKRKELTRGNFSAVPWFELLKKASSTIKPFSEQNAGIDRMFSDIRSGLALHGISASAPTWLSELTIGHDRITSLPSAFILPTGSNK